MITMNVKKIISMRVLLLATMAFCAFSLNSQAEDSRAYMISGASFAIRSNGWFEMACAKLSVKPINKARGGESIINTAKAMFNDEFYTKEELRKTEALIIMHVHNRNVAETKKLKENYKDYTLQDVTRDYSVAFDYVIKRYTADCQDLKNDKLSEYFGTKDGKPPVIVLCTHWHDARVTYKRFRQSTCRTLEAPYDKI